MGDVISIIQSVTEIVANIVSFVNAFKRPATQLAPIDKSAVEHFRDQQEKSTKNSQHEIETERRKREIELENQRKLQLQMEQLEKGRQQQTKLEKERAEMESTNQNQKPYQRFKNNQEELEYQRKFELQMEQLERGRQHKIQWENKRAAMESMNERQKSDQQEWENRQSEWESKRRLEPEIQRFKEDQNKLESILKNQKEKLDEQERQLEFEKQQKLDLEKQKTKLEEEKKLETEKLKTQQEKSKQEKQELELVLKRQRETIEMEKRDVELEKEELQKESNRLEQEKLKIDARSDARYQKRDADIVKRLRDQAKVQIGLDSEKDVNIGIIGRSGVGKSTLTNGLRGLRNSDAKAAPVGVTECTENMKKYLHPEAVHLALWDIPGSDTFKFPRMTYFEDNFLYAFDYLVFVFTDRFGEAEIDMMKRAVSFRVPFVIVRNKINRDFEDKRRDNIDFGSLPQKDAIAALIEELKNDTVKRIQSSTDIPLPPIYIINALALTDENQLNFQESELIHFVMNEIYKRRYSNGASTLNWKKIQ